MAKSAIKTGDITITENESNPENEEAEEHLDKTATISRKERLRKVQQRIQMRVGVCKMDDVMKNVNNGDECSSFMFFNKK